MSFVDIDITSVGGSGGGVGGGGECQPGSSILVVSRVS